MMRNDQLTMNHKQLLEGYKQTEVGVIPEDWKICTVGELDPYVTSGSRGWAKYYSKFGAPFIRITNLTRESIYLDLADLKVVDLPQGVNEGKRTELYDGDILVSITADIGIIGYIDASVPKPAYINQHVSLVRFEDKKSNSKFIAYFLGSENVQRLFRGATDQGAKAGLNLDTIRSLKFAFPPLPEQRAIAQALSDADALIAALEKTIAKKRSIKTATMQQLLTGRKRLPGFSKKWTKTLFSNFVSYRKERVDPRKAGVQEFCIELEHIESGTGQLIGHSIAGAQASLKGIFYAGDVLFGKLRSYLRKYWLASCKGVCSTELWILVADPQFAVPEFIYQTVTTNQFIELASTAYGTHMPRADWNVVKDFEIELPPLEEQQSIATVLSDMDAEIAALEARLAKTQAIKQGMMQELLTGRTRLV